MTDKPDPMELAADLEKFATNPSERQLAKELGSLLFDHSTLKVENAKLKRDMLHYKLMANAEAELVDMLQKENRELVRQNGEWQAKCEADEALLRQALECIERKCAALTTEHVKGRLQTITAIKERLG
jgi:hypothetical protein